jgi:hypothetical protein
MHQKVTLIFRITSLSVLPIPQEGDLSRLPVLENGFDNVRSYYLERRSVTAAQQLVYVLNSLYTALVPLLLGAIGACTYVLRLMSQQIADTTFSSTSPIRHFVRVALGALAGVAIGLGGTIRRRPSVSGRLCGRARVCDPGCFRRQVSPGYVGPGITCLAALRHLHKD